jgi:rod shape-determining protein MreC
MKRLFQFIYYYRAFFTFLFFEIICALIIAGSGKYQSSGFFNTANFISSSVFTVKNNIGNYFGLKRKNLDLAKENAFLRQIISESEQENKFSLPEYRGNDTVFKTHFEYITAKVINNSVRKINNFLTINKGTGDGVEPGMGVISSWGIVGKVRASSENFSTVYSLLHQDLLVSSEIKRNNVICTTTWTGEDPDYADLLYVPRHIKIFKGDTILTSGYNAIFPENIPIGVIDDFGINENETFYHIKVKLATDFRTLSYVYVIKNNFGAEKDSLEQATYSR